MFDKWSRFNFISCSPRRYGYCDWGHLRLLRATIATPIKRNINEFNEMLPINVTDYTSFVCAFNHWRSINYAEIGFDQKWLRVMHRLRAELHEGARQVNGLQRPIRVMSIHYLGVFQWDGLGVICFFSDVPLRRHQHAFEPAQIPDNSENVLASTLGAYLEQDKKIVAPSPPSSSPSSSCPSTLASVISKR